MLVVSKEFFVTQREYSHDAELTSLIIFKRKQLAFHVQDLHIKRHVILNISVARNQLAQKFENLI